jgi:hypothetical protein
LLELAAANIMEGSVFRSIRKGGKVTDRRLSAKSVCDLVKKHGAHSLRAGFLTSAAGRTNAALSATEAQKKARAGVADERKREVPADCLTP